MIKIAIIGVGGIGARHLQALAECNESFEIYLIDPNKKSIHNAENIFNTDLTDKNILKSKFKIHKIDQVNLVKDVAFDICIIATTADIRYNVLQEFLDNCHTKYLILEKVLFQKIADFVNVENLLQYKNVKTYVNCNYRLKPYFKDIKNYLNHHTAIELIVTGFNWGIACNAIHFIDLLCYYTGDISYHLNNGLFLGTFPSKREGFIEVYGNLNGKTSSGHIINLQCNEGRVPHCSVRIKQGSNEYLICEQEQCAIYMDTSKPNACDVLKYELFYQSKMTKSIVNDLLESGTCDLPNYCVAKTLHVPFVELLIDHYNNETLSKIDVCPIT